LFPFQSLIACIKDDEDDPNFLFKSEGAFELFYGIYFGPLLPDFG